MINGRRLTRLGLLITAGLILNLLERQIPPPVPIPGVRLGLANIATLAALAMEGTGAALLVWALRFVLAALFSGSLFGPGFWVGGTGGLAAWLVMAILAARFRVRGGPLQPSAAGLSLAGAVAHHVGQLAAAAWVTGRPEVLYMLPLLLAVAVPVGLLTGALAGMLLKRLRQAGALPQLPPWVGPPRAADLLLVTGVALAAGALWASWSPRSQQPTVARVSMAGQTIMELDLQRDTEISLEAPEGPVRIQVRDGAVQVTESHCHDQLCMLTGWVRTPGQMIICVPNQLVILIAGEEDGAPDAILQ